MRARADQQHAHKNAPCNIVQEVIRIRHNVCESAVLHGCRFGIRRSGGFIGGRVSVSVAADGNRVAGGLLRRIDERGSN